MPTQKDLGPGANDPGGVAPFSQPPAVPNLGPGAGDPGGVAPFQFNPATAIQQAQQQHDALQDTLQSILDDLGQVIDTRATVSNAALTKVTNDLRAAARQSGAQSQQRIDSVLGEISTHIANRDMLSEAMLGNIVAELSGNAPTQPVANAYDPIGTAGSSPQCPPGTVYQPSSGLCVAQGVVLPNPPPPVVPGQPPQPPTVPGQPPQPIPPITEPPPPFVPPAPPSQITPGITYVQSGLCANNQPVLLGSDGGYYYSPGVGIGNAPLGQCTGAPPFVPPVPPYVPPFVPPTPPFVPPPPPPPPPPAPPPPPTNPCHVSAFNMGQIPPFGAIGSDEWCRNIADVSAFLAQAGQSITVWVQGQLPTPDRPLIPTLPMASGIQLLSPLAWAWNFCVTIWNGLSCFTEAMLSAMTTATQVAFAVFSAVGGGNAGQTAYLVVIKAAVSMLKRLRLGTDAGVWATLDITIDWPQAEELMDYLINYTSQSHIPNTSQAMHLFRGGWIGHGTYVCWLKCNGDNPDVFSPVLESGRPRPAVHERQVMLWRNREGVVPENIVWNDDAYKQQLAIDGYNADWQNALMSVRYQVYTLREIRQLLDSGVIGRQETYNAFRDMGFDDAKSNVLADMEIVLTNRRREQEVIGYTPARLSQLYRDGQMKEADVRDHMTALGYSPSQATRLLNAAADENESLQLRKYFQRSETAIVAATEKAYKQGTLSRDAVVGTLVTLGASSGSANSLVSSWDMEEKAKVVDASIAGLKRGYMSGQVDRDGAMSVLANAGLSTDKALQTVSIWQFDRDNDQRQAAVGKLLSAVSDGYMSAADAGARLHNMGYRDDDSQLLIDEAERKMQEAMLRAESAAAAAAERMAKAAITQQAKDRKAAELASARAAKAAEQLVKQADHNRKLGEDAIRKATPLGELKRWLASGIISQEIYLERLHLMGYPDGVAQTMMQEICNNGKAGCVSTAGPNDAAISDSGNK